MFFLHLKNCSVLTAPLSTAPRFIATKRPPFFLYDSPTTLATLLATRQRRA